MGYRHRYQLLRLARKSAICKHNLAERLKSGFALGLQLAPPLGELKRGLWVHFIAHRSIPLDVKILARCKTFKEVVSITASLLMRGV